MEAARERRLHTQEDPVRTKQPTTTPTTTPAPHATRSRGTIEHTYPERGFGFIRCTEGAAGDVGEDFFFHESGLSASGLTLAGLLRGTVVEFDPTEVPRGRRAEHVTPV
jgi:cold shock CspA family protein